MPAARHENSAALLAGPSICHLATLRAAFAPFLAPRWRPEEAYGLATGGKLARPGAHEIQLDLFLDYASNIELYPAFQEYFRTRRPPLLAIWGRNDPFFLPAGAKSFKRDIPDADVRLLDTGHFALETHSGEIAAAIRGFLSD